VHQNQWLERQKTNRLKRGAWWFQGGTTTTHQLEFFFFFNSFAFPAPSSVRASFDFENSRITLCK